MKPTSRINPALADAAIQVDIINLGGNAGKMLNYLNGAYAIFYVPEYGFILTDEALDLDEPRWTSPTLETLIEWLELQWEAVNEESEEFPC